ncbi:MAG: FtsX-like permease family protein [Proteobacteria bacterium]|nr:FtsX-like permease family protein [Pseudomonadota bacterium]
MTTILFSYKNLLRHKTRSFLTLVGITASIAVLYSIISFNKGFEAGLSKELERTGLHFMIVPSGCPHEVASLVLHGAVIPKYLDDTVSEKIRNFKDISLISPILVTQLPNQIHNKIDLVYGMEMSHLKNIKPQWNIKGSIPDNDEGLILGSEVFDHMKVKIGDTYSYGDKKFTITGVLEKTGSQDDAFIYIPITALQKMLNKEGKVTALGVKVLYPEKLTEIIEKLSNEIPGIQIVTMNQVMNSISSLASSAKILSLSVAIIALIISAVGVMNSILMTVFERTQEIGMMRAIGAGRNDIFKIIITETILLTTTGGLAGLIISNIGSGLIEDFVRKFMPYVPAGKILLFDYKIALFSLIFSIFVGVVSGLYPAYRASKVSPIEAIKG